MLCRPLALVAWAAPLAVKVPPWRAGAGKSLSHKLVRAITPWGRPRRLCLTMTNEDGVTLDMLSADEKAVAVSAIRVTQALFVSAAQTNSSYDPGTEEDTEVADLSVGDILAFCGVKGVPLQGNIWDRKWLLKKAREYFAWERAARLKTGDDLWDTMVDNRKVRLLHDVCNGEGDATYVDPRSGYTVFSAFAHLRRGRCCGVVLKEGNGEDKQSFERTHRCRHCPYTHDGRLSSAQSTALMDRLRVIRFVRENRTTDWQTLARNTALFSLSGGWRSEQKINTEDETGKSGTQNKEEGAYEMSHTLGTVVGSLENKQRLRRKLVQRVFADDLGSKQQNQKDEKASCKTCGGERVTTCTRCNGWTAVFSPHLQKCRQCDGEGMHPCMSCTLFRPPPLTTIYS